MRARERELDQAGARLVFVGSGTPAMAAEFARAHAGPHRVLADGELRTYRAAGMRGGAGTVLRWRLLPNLWRAWRAGFRQAKVQGDAWQLGGVLVADGDGRELHRQIDRAAGDPLDLDTVVAAVRGGEAGASS